MDMALKSTIEADSRFIDGAVETAAKSPFERPDKTSDVTFIVEGKELHFCKSFLAASSPVFEKMFSSDFKEKESSAIPLPDKTYEEMDIFLQQFHPAYFWKLINGQH